MSAKGDYRYSFGLSGERAAEDYLVGRGLSVIERRFRCRHGEIDLICADSPSILDAAEIIFVEVKARSAGSFGTPEAAVSRSKRLRIVRTAHVYMHQMGLEGINARFDVISIFKHRDRPAQLEHFADAFGVHELMNIDPWSDE